MMPSRVWCFVLGLLGQIVGTVHRIGYHQPARHNTIRPDLRALYFRVNLVHCATRSRAMCQKVIIRLRMVANVFVSQQVEILQLENNLAAARKRLGEMRKISYLE